MFLLQNNKHRKIKETSRTKDKKHKWKIEIFTVQNIIHNTICAIYWFTVAQEAA